jgi:8-oxo-dGTP diphosphatase
VPDARGYARPDADPCPDPYAHALVSVHSDTDPDAQEVTLALVAERAQGQEPLTRQGPRVSAIVACVDGVGRVLIVRQTAGPFAGAWLLPGGNVERDERLEDAARRELLEETGYRAESLRAVALYEVRSAPPGRFHFLVHLFRGTALEGTARAEAGSEVRWSVPGELDPHPNLAIALVDLGLVQRDRAALARELAAIGIDMRRVL